MAYDLYLYYANISSCTAITDSKPKNNIIWFISRSIEDVLWIYPFIYIFWPEKAKLKSNSSVMGAEEIDSDDEEDIWTTSFDSSLRGDIDQYKNMRFS